MIMMMVMMLADKDGEVDNYCDDDAGDGDGFSESCLLRHMEQ